MKVLILSVAIVQVFLSVLAVSINLTSNNVNDLDWRLPNNVYPVDYIILLETNVHDNGNRDYSGEVKIVLNVKELTNTITLHSKQLDVKEVMVFNDAVLADNIEYHIDTSVDFLIIETQNGFWPEISYQLVITFAGQLRLDGVGFFRSEYEINGQIKYLAVTQFEPNYARYAFPCFDEPGYKATFYLEITHDNSYHALSTTNVDVHRELNNNRITTVFHGTPVMPLYTLAFLISNFTVITSDLHIPQQSFYSRPDATHNLQFALQHSITLLNVLEKYYDLKYYLPKIDNAAIPDFSPGAMENLGLIIYREERSIIDENNAPYNQKIIAMLTIAHEMAHQYFGNLVTPKWWSDIWLSEGFATLFEYYAVDIIYPEYKTLHLFNIQKLQTVLKADSLITTQSLYKPIISPAEISAAFSTIAYDKSGCILRMIQNAFGNDFFKETLSFYLKNHQYQNVVPADLYEAFDTVYKLNHSLGFDSFDMFIDSWVKRQGYPKIAVSYNSSLETINFYQTQCWSDSSLVANDGNWWIPINIATAEYPDFDNTTADFFIQGEVTKYVAALDIRNFDPSKWYIINKQQSGYYRVNYEQVNWNRLADQLQIDRHVIHVLNRGQLIDDSFALAKTGDIHYSIPLLIAEYLKEETDFNPWMAAIIHFDELDRLIEDETTLALFRRFIAQQIEPVYIHLGLNSKPDEEILPKYLRRTVTYFTCRMGNDDCRTKTYAMLQDILSTGVDVHPDIQWQVYCSGLRQANEREFLNFMKKLKASNNQQHRGVMIEGLSCITNEQYLMEFLESTLAINNFGYRDAEKTRVVVSVVKGSRNGIMYALNFYSENSAEFLEEVKNGPSLRQSLASIAAEITTSTQYNTFINLVTNKFSSVVGDLELADILSTAEINVKWGNSDKMLQIQEYFSDYFPTSTSSSTTLPTSTSSTQPTTTESDADSRANLKISVSTMIIAVSLALFVFI